MIRTLSAMATALTLTAPVSALAQDRENIVLQTFSTATVFAPPPWASATDAVMAESEIFQNGQEHDNGSKTYILEFIPKGQSFDAWTQMHALMAQVPAQPAADHYAQQIAIYEQACTTMDHEHVVALDDHQAGVVLCGAYADDPTTGEVFVINQVARHGTAVKVYYHKRGPAFDVADPATYPLPLSSIADVLADLSATGVYPVTP
ncbi:MAG: hypothetical protein ACPG7W_07125 [Paracoccaceae bacterium]